MSEYQGRTPEESLVQMMDIAFPNDANPLGTVFGGKVLNIIDICGSMAAMRHCRQVIVTASIDSVDFHSPIHVGEWIIARAWVNYTGRTSMEVQVEIHAENALTGEKRHCCTAFLTYVALNNERRPMPVPPIHPQTPEEQRRYREAEERRKLRLALRRRRGYGN